MAKRHAAEYETDQRIDEAQKDRMCRPGEEVVPAARQRVTQVREGDVTNGRQRGAGIVGRIEDVELSHMEASRTCFPVPLFRGRGERGAQVRLFTATSHVTRDLRGRLTHKIRIRVHAFVPF